MKSVYGWNSSVKSIGEIFANEIGRRVKPIDGWNRSVRRRHEVNRSTSEIGVKGKSIIGKIVVRKRGWRAERPFDELNLIGEIVGNKTVVVIDIAVRGCNRYNNYPIAFEVAGSRNPCARIRPAVGTRRRRIPRSQSPSETLRPRRCCSSSSSYRRRFLVCISTRTSTCWFRRTPSSCRCSWRCSCSAVTFVVAVYDSISRQ